MMKTFRKLSAVAALAAAAATGAQAAPVGLAIVLDESGSISGTDWTTQLNGYANVLGSSLIQTNGSLVIGVWKFAQGVEQVFAPTLLDDAGDKAALVAAINGMVRANTGATSIGDAITTAFSSFQSYATTAGGTIDSVLAKMVIDVSTDGQNNNGLAPDTAVTNVVAGGVDQVNCLGVGGSADCSWNRAGTDLDFTASTFADFERILGIKIATETNVPEPASLALAGLALAGVAASRRRAKAA